MRATTEIFDNIKILKLYNWENEFMRKTLIARRDEMDAMSYVFRIFIITFNSFYNHFIYRVINSFSSA